MPMFLTSFNVYFVFGYAYFCVHALTLLPGFFWDKVWLFLVKTGWQPCNPPVRQCRDGEMNSGFTCGRSSVLKFFPAHVTDIGHGWSVI